MPEVVLKLPRPVQKVKIIRSDELIKDSYLQKKTIKPEKIEKKSEFIEKFKISSPRISPEELLNKVSSSKLHPKKLNELLQESYSKGYLDGQEEAKETLQYQIQSLQKWLQNFDSISQDLRSQYSKAVYYFEESLVLLAVMIAEHILEHEISESSDIVIEQTRKAITSAENDTIFKIHLYPDNIEILKNAKSTLASDSSKVENVVLVADKSVDQGGCILETSTGKIDARIKTQLEMLKKSLSGIPQQPSVLEESRSS